MELYINHLCIIKVVTIIKNKLLIAILASTLLLSGCTAVDNGEYYSFAEVFSWVNAITKDTLKGVRIEDGYIGVNPETANPTIKYSEDERDIDYNLMVLETKPLIKTENQDLDGETYRLVTYILNNGAEYEIKINNGRVIYRDFNSYQEFRFDSTPTSMPDVFYLENN